MAARKLAVVKSIQATQKRSMKTSTAQLQAKSLKKAHRQGVPWSDDEVSRLVQGINNDEQSFDIALSLGRSYYATMSTRRIVAFAMRHKGAIY